MVRLTGAALRPHGSDGHWPTAGTVVDWRLSRPVADLAKQAEELDIPILGIIGNEGHLAKHGDHTPWSAGKKRGVIYAIDLDVPDDFGKWLVATCKSDYPTTWIDFWNFAGGQYDNAGARVAGSGDHHLHISVAKGHEEVAVTLLTDYMASRKGKAKKAAPAAPAEEADVSRGDDIYGLLHDGKRPQQAQTSGGGVPIAWIVREIKALHDELAEIKELLTRSAG